MKAAHRFLTASVVALGICVMTAPASAKIFLQIPGVAGEVQDGAHSGWISVDSVAWSTGSSGNVGSGAAAGREPTAVTIIKPIDRSSAALMQAASTGRRFATMTIEEDGPSGARYVSKLQDALISAVKRSASSGEPIETVIVQFARRTTELPRTSTESRARVPTLQRVRP